MLECGNLRQRSYHKGIMTTSASAESRSLNSFPKVYEQALATILQLVLANTGSPATTTEPPLADRSRRRFTAATDFVEEHLDRKVGLSAEYGVSPHRYLTVRRIERAKALLRTTDDTVASIAQRAGFASQAHFSQSFGKVVGVTPTAYRHAA
jgi:transcriptional regulator GlxA family with amidase domain